MISRGKLRLFQFMFIASVALALSGCAQPPTLKTARRLKAAKASAKKKDYKRAILELRNALQATPKNAEIYYQLALAYRVTGDLLIPGSAWHQSVRLGSCHAIYNARGSSSMPREKGERAGLRPPVTGQRRPMPAKTEPQFSPAMTMALSQSRS